MLNIWPRMMREAGRKPCEETLRLVAGTGYTLHELALAPGVWEQGANKLKVPRTVWRPCWDNGSFHVAGKFTWGLKVRHSLPRRVL